MKSSSFLDNGIIICCPVNVLLKGLRVAHFVSQSMQPFSASTCTLNMNTNSKELIKCVLPRTVIKGFLHASIFYLTTHSHSNGKQTREFIWFQNVGIKTKFT